MQQLQHEHRKERHSGLKSTTRGGTLGGAGWAQVREMRHEEDVGSIDVETVATSAFCGADPQGETRSPRGVWRIVQAKDRAQNQQGGSLTCGWTGMKAETMRPAKA